VNCSSWENRRRPSGGGDGPFESPDWSTDDLAVARKALNDLAVLGFDTTYAFGRKEPARSRVNTCVTPR
jgi:hypothetical protein